MKRKIALLLAAVMTVAMLPMNAMADSSASLSRNGLTFQADKVLLRGADVDVENVHSSVSSDYRDDFTSPASVEPISLDIRPTSGEVEQGQTIILRVTNGKFNSNLLNYYEFTYHKVDFRTLLDQQALENADWNDFITDLGNNANSDHIRDTLQDYCGSTTNALPYDIRIINEEEAEVTLAPLPSKYVNQNNGDICTGYPTYKIALPITTEDSDEGDLTVSVDGNGSSITDINDRKVATVTDSDGSTTASVVQSQVKTKSTDSIEVPTITIREDLAGTFDDQEIELRVNGNYEIDTNARVVASTGVNTRVKGTFGVSPKPNNSRTLLVELSDFAPADGSDPEKYNCKGKTTKNDQDEDVDHDAIFDTSNLSTIVISGIVVIAKDDDTYGDVNITISGDKGISTQTIKVAERQDYGFKLEALEEPTIIYSGRTPFAPDSDVDDFVTAEFEFGETSPEAWLSGRKLEFTVPQGVKIVGYEITKDRYFANSSLFQNASIVDDGTTLKFAPSNDLFSNNRKDSAYIDLKLYLTASINFTGDCAVSVSGAGLDADTLDDLVIAKFVTPVTVETTSTKSNMGYKSVETSDIKIVENSAGALGDNNEVEIWLDNTYAQDIAFDDTNASFAIDGEVEIKNFDVKDNVSRVDVEYKNTDVDFEDKDGNKVTGKVETPVYNGVDVTNGVISFKIDSESYSTPSTVTLTGLSVGTTRSIPYGNYSVYVGGNAIVDNYKAYVDTVSTIPVKSGVVEEKTESGYADFDNFEDDGFEFADYLQIVTDTTTLDGVVEVTIGEKSIKMNGQSYDMDVAAYIQTASNSTMVPLRFVTLALGVDQASITDADNTSKIAWDANTKTATIFYAAGSGQKIIQFTAGSPVMKVDGVEITMENGVVSEIVDGRMFVPFRALGQALGVPVSWNADTRTAIYNEQLAAADTENSAEEPVEETTAAAEETTEAAAEETTEAAAE